MIKINKEDLSNKTDFIIMPANTNYMNIIFGGFFMSQLDLAAATIVNRAVRYSRTADKAVTHKFHVEFSKPSYAGDIITIQSEIKSLGRKSIVVKQRSFKETRKDSTKVIVAVSELVFVTMNEKEYVNHGLTL